MSRWTKIALAGVVVSVVAASVLTAQPRSLRVPPDKAVLIIRVPAGDASVKIADYQTQQGGYERLFSTPVLTAGQSYSYPVEASWTDAGQARKEVRQVWFKAGEVSVVDFRVPSVEKIAMPVAIDKNVDKNPNVVEKKPTVKERQFLFTYAGTVKNLSPGKVANVWLPVPVSGPEQEVATETMHVEFIKLSKGIEKQYGNKIMYFEAKANEKGEIPFEVVYRVTRKEVRTDVAANLTLKPAETENLTRFLEPDAKVPITGKPLELLKEKKVPSDQFAAARVFYDVVNNHMKYSKEGKGWGNGDSVWACDSKFGNCSDFHSLFISMARGNKIPSKFEMGFPIPTKHGEGVVGGYHCWAWFMPNQKGWVPVDISEANRNPELKEYYFGNLTEDRVRFSTGRDIDLEPRQKGPPLNFFIYPYVEVDGKTHPQEMIDRRFAYKDVK